MESSKLNRIIEEELEDFCAGCNRYDICIRHKWVFDDNDYIIAAKNNIKHFNQYEKKELSFLHMKYLFMKNNHLRELTNAKLMEWMESLGWPIRFGDEIQRRATRYNTIEELEEVYGSGQIR